MKEKNKIKIFLLADTLDAYCGNAAGGAEKQILSFCQKISKGKFEVIVGCISKPDRLLNAINQFNIKTVCFGIRRIYSLRGIIEGIKFSYFLKKERIDIIMTYHFGADIWGGIFASLARVPVIISNRRDAGFWRKTSHIMAYRLTNRFVRKIITVSKAVNEMLIREENVPPQSIELIHNGIDLERFSSPVDKTSKKRELGIAQDALVIGCVGNVRPVKGHSYLIDAAHSVVSTFPNAHFLMIGEYQANGWIEDKLNNLQLKDKVQLLGMRNDVSEILSACDICVLPSLSEGLSNALLEYMAAGKPIVATDAGGNAELIQHMVSGLLTKKADSKDLADKIIMLLENANLREKLSRQAKEDAKDKFPIEKMIKKYEKLFEELTERKCEVGRKTNILHLISSSGFYGAERVMLQLAKESNCNGTKSWVSALNNAYNSHLEVIDAARENRLPAHAFESRGRFDWKTINSLCDFIKDNNIDILHTHNYKANLIGLLAAKKAKIPAVATLHGYIGNGFRLKLYERLDRFILKYFNKVILVDKSLKKHFNNSSINMEVINNGVNTNDLPISSAAAPQDKKEITIGTVGRLSQEKGHKYLIEAFAGIIKDYPDSRLLIVGDGILRKELENLCAALRISENVTFTGFQENVSRYYRQMDIYVSCSLVEHFPMAILEAMSFKKAIVATNVGGTQDLIEDKVTGLLVNSGSADEIREAILNYINIPSLRETYGKNACQFVKENYSLGRMVKSYKKIYEDTIYYPETTPACRYRG